MKKIICLLIIILTVLLTACSKDSTTSDNLTTSVNLSTSEKPTSTPSQLGLILFLEDSSTIVDYASLGFDQDLFEPADWGPAVGVFNRQDGVINPFFDHVPVTREDYVFQVDEDTEHYDEYFPQNVYNIYTVNAFTHSNNHYAYYMQVENGFVLRFFDHNASTVVSYYAGYFVDVIESNGVYSYILNSAYYASDASVKEQFYEAFHSIYHEDGFPYAVYFSNHQIFLINKNESFDKECMYNFELSGEVELFKY
ncbi:MAG: hypothetical protein A2Y16_04390 [Tenericutes bacterium GWF2_57_13]|nr:MAG: hypothetical protein A2Y16_04390 [Tenericutes bacterium GWF2_57_13]